MKLLSIDIDNISDSTLNFLVGERDINPLILDRIAKTYVGEIEIIKHVIDNPSTLPETIAFLNRYSTDEIKGYITNEKALIPFAGEIQLTDEERILFLKEEEGIEKKDRGQKLTARIQRMTVSQKIQLAFRGNKEVRSILIRDGNKNISLSVIENPKITETEIEHIAQSRNVSEDILRTIAKNREWIKIYSVVNSLVNNPKTPVGVSLSLINVLKNRELQSIEKSKGIASVLRTSAKRLITLRSAKG